MQSNSRKPLLGYYFLVIFHHEFPVFLRTSARSGLQRLRRGDQRPAERPGLQHPCAKNPQPALPVLPRQSPRVGAEEQAAGEPAAASSAAAAVPTPVRPGGRRADGRSRVQAPGYHLEFHPHPEARRAFRDPARPRGDVDAPGRSRGADRHHHPRSEGSVQRAG